jgi:multidrug resistance efflux pump
MRPSLVAALLIAASSPTLPAQDLPTKTAEDADFDFEPKLMLEDVPETAEPSAASPTDSSAAVERAKGKLDRVRQKQARWEKLARAGVVSRSEAERCAVEVADAQARYEAARASHARVDCDELRKRVAAGTADKSLLEAAEAALKSATDLAVETAAQSRQRRIEYARVTLDRQRRLLAVGAASKVQVQQAEATLRKLEAETAEK